MLTAPDRRAQIIADLDLPEGLTVDLDLAPIVRVGAPPVSPQILRLFRLDLLSSGPPRLRPREIRIAELGSAGFAASLRLPDGPWLNLRASLPTPRPWHSDTFLAAFLGMTLAAVLLILWAVARLMRPVRLLAEAANRLGRDVNAPPLSEDGPTEVATAARAFNEMASRIRLFVADRTQMLADLDEMEAMIGATLAFARDDAATEPATQMDIAALCRTVADEASDAHPDQAEKISYDGPEKLVIRARPLALKRAISNLVANALNYGGAAQLTLAQESPNQVRLTITDEGPGIPETELEAVFTPFRRLEASRNRETGGTGLGLTIARNILRGHGGDVVLQNRPEGGLMAVASLPV